MSDRTDRGAAGRSRPTRIVLVVLGALCSLLALPLLAAGSVLVWAHATQRDASGFYTTDSHRFTTGTAVLTSRIDLGQAPGEHDWTLAHPVGTVRVVATPTSERATFVGIGPEASVDAWLRDVAHDEVTGANFGPFHTDSTVVTGSSAPGSPAAQPFWAASVSGTGTQTLLWPSDGGAWRIVVMNADGRPGVSVDVTVGAKTGVLLPIGAGLAVGGLLLAAGAAALLFAGLRHQVPVPSGLATTVAVPSAYPARLDGHLDPALRRWSWLYKWFLAIPHLIVLAFLWPAVVVLTVVAGFAVLFTGRYPRSIFQFTVGVLRWSWRVSFYAFGVCGTDRYPPFTLARDPSYPADFDVDEPRELSRGLVLVKWWLLALPHYAVVALFAGGWTVGWRLGAGERLAVSGGLISVLVLVAVVVLGVRGRYPEPVFDFVLGMQRWCFRVAAYALLLRDEYPPFRLDTGGIDPGSLPVPPPPPPPAHGPSDGPSRLDDRADDLADELVGAG